MKKILAFLVVLLLIASLSFSFLDVVFAQGFNAFQQTTFTTVTVGTTLVENTVIGFNQLSWTVSGTVSTCTVSLDSSPDGSTWTVGGIIAGQTCTANGNTVVTAGSANFMRVNMQAISGAGATVVVTYKGWVVNPVGGGLPGSGINPFVATSTLQLPNGTAAAGGLVFPAQPIWFYGGNASGSIIVSTATNNDSVSFLPGGSGVIVRTLLGFSNSANLNQGSGVILDTGFTRSAANVIAVGNGANGDESGLLRWKTCKITTDITLPVNTPTTVCTWSLPAVAQTWAWQCQIPWVISAGTGTNTLAIIANPSQTPTGTTNGSAEIKTTNTNTATEATTAISASGGTTLLTSGTITPAATVLMSSTSGTLLASATAGTFSIQMTAAGTTATAAAKAGATCTLY